MTQPMERGRMESVVSFNRRLGDMPAKVRVVAALVSSAWKGGGSGMLTTFAGRLTQAPLQHGVSPYERVSHSECFGHCIHGGGVASSGNGEGGRVVPRSAGCAPGRGTWQEDH